MLGYATPPDVIVDIPGLLKEAVERAGYKLIHGGLNGFAASGLSYDVEFESVDADFPAEARDKVAAAILARFRDHDISFAYPTQVNLVAEKTKPSPPRGGDVGGVRQGAERGRTAAAEAMTSTGRRRLTIVVQGGNCHRL